MSCTNIHDPIFESEISKWEKDSLSYGKFREFSPNIDEQDILKRRYLAGRILERLRNNYCPSALGIYGGWGTGKTSLLNLIMLKNALDGDGCLKIERIDAWKYDGTGNLFIPVISRLKNLAGNKIRELTTAGEDIARVLTVTGLALTHAFVGYLGGATPKDIKEYGEMVADPVISKIMRVADEISHTEESFQKLVCIAKEANPGCEKIVLCIDNLDRCSPENVVSLLESIKNFVGVENCVWVFAMDSGVVASYINRKYEGTTMDGNSYLDKIIPEQFHLSLTPSQDGKQIVELINKASGTDRIIEGIEDLPQIPKVLVPRRLIKSARKLSEARNKAGKDPKIVFSLILLYHSWPDFYEQLSSPNEKHIEAVLANFFKDNPWWNKRPLLPLNKKFTNDQELTYFLQKIIPRYQEDPIPTVQEIALVLEGLREAGLP